MDRRIFTHLDKYNLDISFDVPLCDYTSFKIGGPADVLIVPHDEDALKAALSFAKENELPMFVLGGGTNVLISDEGVRGVVISTEGLSELSLISDDTIFAGAGVRLSRIAAFARDNSLSGMEFAGGIPGTLGGAVYMNAGAYGGEMKDVVVRTRYMTPDGATGETEGAQHGFSYRRSAFSGTQLIITGSYLKLARGNYDDISALMKDMNRRRTEKQPLSYPSAGSTFKRPEGDFAGRLIEASGLKGASVGGAQVSVKHAGFVINTGGATARDVYLLIAHVQSEVKRLHGVSLEPEVRLIGDFSYINKEARDKSGE
ncbi:MAG: UDP-N-acetylmuramate dehydrogenase [Clostridia bacterium]|nr:UDP-N-acetylmuramate dehydrogenase [Clostridia bacterium]